MMLMALPSELRHSIFKLLADSLEFYFPHPDAHNMPNALGFLSVCRLFHTEASPLILPNATFHCRATEHVVDLLSSLTKEQIASIRYLGFRGTPLVLSADIDFRSYTKYEFSTALQLFPGLQLDTLTIRAPLCRGPFGHVVTYLSVENMVKTGNGYRKLRYVVSNPAFLQWGAWQGFDIERLHQPTTWDAFVRKRDGPESGSCVNVYIAKADAADVEGAALCSDTRETFNQEALLRERDNGDPILEREVLVTVKRGDNCDYVEHGNDLPLELKVLFESKSWWQIKAEERVLRLE